MKNKVNFLALSLLLSLVSCGGSGGGGGGGSAAPDQNTPTDISPFAEVTSFDLTKRSFVFSGVDSDGSGDHKFFRLDSRGNTSKMNDTAEVYGRPGLFPMPAWGGYLLNGTALANEINGSWLDMTDDQLKIGYTLATAGYVDSVIQAAHEGIDLAFIPLYYSNASNYLYFMTQNEIGEGYLRKFRVFVGTEDMDTTNGIGNINYSNYYFAGEFEGSLYMTNIYDRSGSSSDFIELVRVDTATDIATVIPLSSGLDVDPELSYIKTDEQYIYLEGNRGAGTELIIYEPETTANAQQEKIYSTSITGSATIKDVVRNGNIVYITATGPNSDKLFAFDLTLNAGLGGMVAIADSSPLNNTNSEMGLVCGVTNSGKVLYSGNDKNGGDTATWSLYDTGNDTHTRVTGVSLSDTVSKLCFKIGDSFVFTNRSNGSTDSNIYILDENDDLTMLPEAREYNLLRTALQSSRDDGNKYVNQTTAQVVIPFLSGGTSNLSIVDVLSKTMKVVEGLNLDADYNGNNIHPL